MKHGGSVAEHQKKLERISAGELPGRVADENDAKEHPWVREGVTILGGDGAPFGKVM